MSFGNVQDRIAQYRTGLTCQHQTHHHFLKLTLLFFFPQFYPITQIANFHILLSHPSFHILLPTQNSHYNLKLLLYHTILSLLKNKILCILGSYDQFPEKLDEYFSVQESRYCTCVYMIFFF